MEVQNQNNIIVELKNPQAIAPVFSYPLSAGYELFASENITITSGSRAFVDTGATIKIPIGMYGNIPPYVNCYTRIETHELTLDPFTEHRIRVFFTNHSNTDCHIRSGESIALLFLVPIHPPELIVHQYKQQQELPAKKESQQHQQLSESKKNIHTHQYS